MPVSSHPLVMHISIIWGSHTFLGLTKPALSGKDELVVMSALEIISVGEPPFWELGM